MDLFMRLGEELRDLFKDLFHPKLRDCTLSKMEEILKAARLIGGSVAEEAEQLHADILAYLKDPRNKKKIEVLKKHAMRLEHETREI